jgi:hypothetical protein
MWCVTQVSGSKLWQTERSCQCCQESGEREATVSLLCPKAPAGEPKLRRVNTLTSKRHKFFLFFFFTTENSRSYSRSLGLLVSWNTSRAFAVVVRRLSKHTQAKRVGLGRGHNSISSCAFTLTRTCSFLSLKFSLVCYSSSVSLASADCDSSACRLHVQALHCRRGRSCYAPRDRALHRRWKLPFQNLRKTTKKPSFFLFNQNKNNLFSFFFL